MKLCQLLLLLCLLLRLTSPPPTEEMVVNKNQTKSFYALVFIIKFGKGKSTLNQHSAECELVKGRLTLRLVSLTSARRALLLLSLVATHVTIASVR